MVKSDESQSWDEEEYDSDEKTFMHENALNNQSSQPAIPGYYDEESISFSHQGGDAANSSSNSRHPLGLSLSKTPSFLNLVRMSVSKEKYSRRETNDHLGHRSVVEKVKAANFPAASIKIGNWQRVSRHEGDLTAKLYYAKRKLVWEVLEGALKCKIEIQWSDISAIRAILPDNEPGTLEIELSQPPLYFREVNPQPRKHTLWQQAPDFTRGQAPIWRRHIVNFQRGILDKHYEKLLQCNRRLFDLSQRSYPSSESPYFDPTMGFSEMSLNFKRPYGSSYYEGLQYPYQSYSARELPLTLPSNPMSVMSVPYSNVMGVNQFMTHQPQPQTQATLWDQGPSYNNQVYNDEAQYSEYCQPSDVGLLNNLLGDQSQVPTGMINPSYNYANYSSTDNQYDVDHQMMQGGRHIANVTDGFYSQPQVNWNMSHSDNNVVMNNQGSSSLPSYNYPAGCNPTNDNFY